MKYPKQVEVVNAEELKSLTWQYFWQQKLREVGLFFGVVAGIGVFGLCSYFIGNAIVKSEDKFINTFIGLLIMFGVAVVCYMLFEWIKGNWETAQERAKEKLREKKDEK